VDWPAHDRHARLPSPRPGHPEPDLGPDSDALRTLRTIPRARWTAAGPDTSNINEMAGIRQITVHHTGMGAVWFSDATATASYLERIRVSHVGRHWADIGYHLIIDRAGRRWQGRPLIFQGAHVKDHNEHNIGVMVLGNFELQSPSRAQQASLQEALGVLMRHYRVDARHVHTHRELRPTACPGRSLQQYVGQLRGHGVLA
jgi:hypothetical protein